MHQVQFAVVAAHAGQVDLQAARPAAIAVHHPGRRPRPPGAVDPVGRVRALHPQPPGRVPQKRDRGVQPGHRQGDLPGGLAMRDPADVIVQQGALGAHHPGLRASRQQPGMVEVRIAVAVTLEGRQAAAQRGPEAQLTRDEGVDLEPVARQQLVLRDEERPAQPGLRARVVVVPADHVQAVQRGQLLGGHGAGVHGDPEAARPGDPGGLRGREPVVDPHHGHTPVAQPADLVRLEIEQPQCGRRDVGAVAQAAFPVLVAQVAAEGPQSDALGHVQRGEHRRFGGRRGPRRPRPAPRAHRSGRASSASVAFQSSRDSIDRLKPKK